MPTGENHPLAFGPAPVQMLPAHIPAPHRGHASPNQEAGHPRPQA